MFHSLTINTIVILFLSFLLLKKDNNKSLRTDWKNSWKWLCVLEVSRLAFYTQMRGLVPSPLLLRHDCFLHPLELWHTKNCHQLIGWPALPGHSDLPLLKRSKKMLSTGWASLEMGKAGFFQNLLQVVRVVWCWVLFVRSSKHCGTCFFIYINVTTTLWASLDLRSARPTKTCCVLILEK